MLLHSCSCNSVHACLHAGTCEDTDLCVHTYVHVSVELGVGLLLCGRLCGSTS